MRRALTVVMVCAAAVLAPWVVLGTVNAAMGTPDEAAAVERCTRACHHQGCRHEPALPPWLTSDRGLFGETIRLLFRLGDASSLGRRRGYAVANLLFFCALWPALVLTLLAIAVWQRMTIRARRRALTRHEHALEAADGS